MKILAIDPGPVRSAFVEWDGESITDHGIVDNWNLIATFIFRREIKFAAIEMIASYGMAVGSEVFQTCVWIGKFMDRWTNEFPDWSAILIPRKEVCVHLCGSAKAGDSNIRQALIDRLGKPGKKKSQGVTYGITEDQWAALAVAVTVHDRIKCGIYGR